MTPQEFFQLAESSISNNPQDRLPTEIKNIIAALKPSADHLIYDVHTHCFTQDHVPQKREQHRWMYVQRLVMKLLVLLYQIIGWWKKRIRRTHFAYYTTFGRRWLMEHKSGTSSDAVLGQYFHQINYTFEQKLRRNRPHLIIALWMIDLERGISGTVKKPFYTQWKELSDLRDLSQHKKSVIPFLAIDPRNPRILEDFLAAFSGLEHRINRTGQHFLDQAFPFFGVYIYPCLGYLPSDPVLMTIFQVCAAKKIPVTAHCGNASVRFSATRVQGQYWIPDGQDLTLRHFVFDCPASGKARQATAITRFFNAPNNWLPVIAAYPALKINLAYFGGSEDWQLYKNGAPDTLVQQALNMMVSYPNVYADLSNVYADSRHWEVVLEMLYSKRYTPAQRDVFRTKLLNGSGYDMTFSKKDMIKGIFQLIQRFKQDKTKLHQVCVHNPVRFLFS